MVCQDNRIRELVPIRLTDTRQAIGRALDRVRQAQVETCWFDGGGSLPPEWTTCGDADYAGGTVLGGAHRIVVEGEAETVWRTVEAIGGDNGWYFAQQLWRLRGMMDRLVGGPGLRRGRRQPQTLRVGDGLDFWRVIAVEPPHRLLLLAEMKAPGDALLEFLIDPQGPGRVSLKMVSRFLPAAFWACFTGTCCFPPTNGFLRACCGRLPKKPASPSIGGLKRTRLTRRLNVSCNTGLDLDKT